MLKKDFQKILNCEMDFTGKRFTGKNKEDRRDSYIRFAERYYESLGYLTESALEMAFRKCREQFEYFPKINQLLKFCPIQKTNEASYDYKALPQSEASKELMDKTMKGGNKFQIGESQVRNNFSLLAIRWPHTNWDEALNREIEIDSKKMVR